MFTLLMLLPNVGASDPFRDQSCVDTNNCIGPGTCTIMGCVPRSCQPFAYCYGTIISADECAENITIQGETCQGVFGVGGRTNTAGQEAWVGVAVTDGHVDAFNLPNTWLSPSAQVTLTVGGVRFGTLHVGFYRSLIDEEDHQWTNIALVVGQGEGLTGGEAAIVRVHLLDGLPEGCSAGTSRQTVFECPTRSEIRDTLP